MRGVPLESWPGQGQGEAMPVPSAWRPSARELRLAGLKPVPSCGCWHAAYGLGYAPAGAGSGFTNQDPAAAERVATGKWLPHEL